jgi:hypothetical protein
MFRKMFRKFMSLFQKNTDSRPFVRDFIAVKVYEISSSELEELETLKTSLIKEGKYKDVYCVL